jgi:shikimate dehydrogenase
MSKGRVTKLVGIFGDPVAHSRSPAMHNAAFQRLGLDYRYLPFVVPRALLPHAVAAIRALGLVGVNITVPHKERVIPYLDQLTAEARLIGAVNTIVNRRGRLIGDNTDGRGFLLAVRRTLGFSPRGQVVCLLGAGGAARAVAVALMRAGVRRLVIANRTVGRAVGLTTRLRRQFTRSGAELHAIALSPAAMNREVGSYDCLVNATSIGMKPGDPCLVGPAFLRQCTNVCDLIYNPAETRLLRDARRAGSRTMNGLAMLVYQGALSFELWTGRKAPVDVMARAASQVRGRIRFTPLPKSGKH